MSRHPESSDVGSRETRQQSDLRVAASGFRRRLLFAGTVLVLAASFLGWRLAVVQIVEPDRYLARGEAQRMHTEPLVAVRGAIVDRNGVDLALSIRLPSVEANPRNVENPLVVAQQLAVALDADTTFLESRLSGDGQFAWLDRHIHPATALNVAALNLRGIRITQERARVRPGGRSALGVLGRTDVDSMGISGLEKVYNGLLSGIDGYKIIERDLQGASFPGGERSVELPTNGRDLILTLDRPLQFEAERLLAEGVEEAGGESGILIAMDPKTGQVLVSATAVRGDDGEIRQSGEHRAATWTYEPGSIIKPLTIAGVLDASVGSPGTVREVAGRIKVHDGEFEDAPLHDPIELSIADILRRSSNVGTIMWATDLGPEALYAKLCDFGLGRLSALDFPGESSGHLPEPSKWSGTSLPTIAIGQGVSVTPIQMATAYAALANGGVRPAPSLVVGTSDNGGMLQLQRPGRSTTVISSTVAAEIVAMMEGVVESGTGTRAAVPGYRVAGKTGTAWKARPEGGYGSKGDRDYVASFAGFLPADDPQLVVLVVVDEPSLDKYSGGRAAAPIFSTFSQFAVRRLRIPSETDRVSLEEDGRVRARTPTHQRLLDEVMLETAASSTGG
ncbi:MAG: penicillin-binding protein 2 [Acidimicrobiales bacterium]|nr:penicillin-binding protein 2 [Acidimicrobiales bacterium]